VNPEFRRMLGNQEAKPEVWLELSPYARATVHALQNRQEGSGPINWGILAKGFEHHRRAIEGAYQGPSFGKVQQGSAKQSERS
jgi:hypothetical protein